MFMGEYNHIIDAKGRTIVPSKFREELGENFVITKGFDGCLYIYDSKGWEEVENKLKELPMTTPATRKFVRFFMSGATVADVDKQGRTLLPQSLRNHADLKKDVVFVGMANKIEIWSKERWDACDYSDMDEITAQMEELGFRV